MILMVDNYDSFTYNLVQYIGELGRTVDVVRNDAVGIEEILALCPEAVVISPGPGRPEDAGISVELVRAAAGRVPLLGVCLGHQAIGVAFGGAVAPAPTLVHGKVSPVRHDGSLLYQGVPDPFDATRYHSLVVDRPSLPACLLVSAWTDDGTVMGMRHESQAIFGVQFHPESILTTHGKRLLANFLESL
ncbi:MAG: anthranilate synthase component II [Acidobacteriota bacterium]